MCLSLQKHQQEDLHGLREPRGQEEELGFLYYDRKNSQTLSFVSFVIFECCNMT
jgi:hypothetical protein